MRYRLEFTEHEMQVLNSALVELPFRIAAPVIRSINDQIAATVEQDDQTGRKNT